MMPLTHLHCERILALDSRNTENPNHTGKIMTQDDDKKPDFEHALKELENLVEQLESGELSLDETLKQFRRGVELTRHCQTVLDQAQQSVEQLMTLEVESNANPVEDLD
jgi:exodeoxyribonuclease VII small subunit